MSVTLTGAQSWGVRMGHLGGWLNNLNGGLGSAAPTPASLWGASGPTISALDTNVSNVFTDFTTLDTQNVNGLYTLRDEIRGAQSSGKQQIAALMQQITIDMVDRDTQLHPRDLPTALRELIRQFGAAAASLNAPVVTITPAAITRPDGSANVGNAVVTGSVLDPRGEQADMCYAEVIELLVSADSFAGGQTAGQEQMDASGDEAVTDPLSPLWPKGSGARQTLTLADAGDEDSDANNLATNGSFDNQTSNVPDGWTLDTGVAGTNLVTELSDVYTTGGKAIKFVGDVGGTLTALRLTFAEDTLTARGVYALNAFVHVDASAPAAGKLRFALVDGSNNVINDDNANPNSYTVNLTQTTLQSTYKATGAMTTTELDGATVAGGGGEIYFRLPSNLPSTIKLELKLTTALTSTEPAWVDQLCLIEAVQLYGDGVGGGPYVAVFAGSTAVVNGDKWKLTVANDLASTTNTDNFVLLLWRTFDLPGLGLAFPTSGAATVADSLIL